MRRIWSALIVFACLCLSAASFHVDAAPSRDGAQTYRNEQYGVTFQYPAGWTVVEQAATQTLTAASVDDQKAITAGTEPSGLIVTITFSTFRQIGAQTTADFPDRLKATGASADTIAQPARIGGADGVGLDLLDGNSGVAGRTAMLAVGGRRIAVVRGVATIKSWVNGGSQAQYEALIGTLSFFPPASAINEDRIGRALWTVSDPGFGSFADVGATADGTAVLATDPHNGVWTISANGTVSGLKKYDGIGEYGSVGMFRDGTKYIADPVNHVIWLIQPDGSIKKLLGGTVGTNRGTFGKDSPRVFAFGYQNTLNILDVTDKGTRIQVFGRGGDVLTAWDIDPIENGALATDPNGYVYVVGSNHAGIIKIGASGKVVKTDLAAAALTGLIARAIVVDRFGNIYVATDAAGILKLDASGALQGIIGEPYDESAPPKAGQLGKPSALTLAQDSNLLYVADSGKYPQIVAFALNGNASINVDAGTKAIGAMIYGQSTNGEITRETFVNIYSFVGKAGEIVTITMRAAAGSNLDPYVDLLDSGNALVAANDDAPTSAKLGARDAQIAAFKLRFNGTYTIRATRFGRETTDGVGAYTLTLEKSN